MMALRLTEWLGQYIGLNSASIGMAAIDAARRERMKATGLSDEAAYTQLLDCSAQERALLMALIIVPETWFFRDLIPFQSLERYLLETWLPNNLDGFFRALCAPCSSGEEAYSMAAVLHAVLPEGSWEMDAVDIDRELLARAEHGKYSKRSLRGKPLPAWKLFSDTAADGLEILPELRRKVRFYSENLVHPDSLIGQPPYSVIFCRNLLIYLHDRARQEILYLMDSLLAPGGICFVGHAEMMVESPESWRPLGEAGAFAYQKVSPEKPKSDFFKEEKKRRAEEGDSVNPLAFSEAAKPLPESPAEAEDLYAEVCRLADQGKLSEALGECRYLLQRYPAEAKAHFLFGILEEALGDFKEAEKHFHRAVYLDADCDEALLHLAVLRERSGDAETAGRFRIRAAQAAAVKGK